MVKGSKLSRSLLLLIKDNGLYSVMGQASDVLDSPLFNFVQDDSVTKGYRCACICILCCSTRCLPAERGRLALAEHEHGRLQLLHLAEDGGQHGPLDHKRLHLHLTTFTQTKYYNTVVASMGHCEREGTTSPSPPISRARRRPTVNASTANIHKYTPKHSNILFYFLNSHRNSISFFIFKTSLRST